MNIFDLLVNQNTQNSYEYNVIIMALLIVQLAIDFILLTRNGQIKGKYSQRSIFDFHLFFLSLIHSNSLCFLLLIIEKYWQLELAAIKATFNNKGEGKRSKSSNLQAKSMPNYLNKKQEKQMLLRKLQFDIVSSYYNWYLLLVAIKLISVIAAISKFWSILSSDVIFTGPGAYLPNSVN